MQSKRGFRYASISIGVSVWLLLAVLPTLSQEGRLQAGYALLSVPDDSTAPVATALFSFRNPQGVLVSQAGVQAVAPLQRGRIFVDERVKTGLALVNPANVRADLSLTLRDSLGSALESRPLALEAGAHLPRFVDELFGGLPPGFRGTLTLESDIPVAAVTLRQALNTRREALLATLPVVDLGSGEEPAGPDSAPLLFPHVGAGVGAGVRLSTQIILINRASQRVRGRLELRDSSGGPLRVQTDGGEEGALLDFELQPQGTWERTLTSSGPLVQGYAVVSAGEGPPPAGTAVFQFRDGQGGLVSEAGVGAVEPTSRARIFVDTLGTRTGLALANTGQAAASVHFRLLDRFGFPLRDATRPLGAGRHDSRFADDLFAGLPAGFTGILEIESDRALALVTLALATNARGDLVLTTLPVADLERPPREKFLVLPQIGFGQGFATRLILINPQTGAAAAGHLRLFGSDGSPLEVPLAGSRTASLEYRLPAGSARQHRPGNSAAAAAVVADVFEPGTSEIAVAPGATVRIRPAVIDSAGDLRDDFEIELSSADPNVASVDDTGAITGLETGFSTLVIRAGPVVAAPTVSVVRVEQGGNPFQIVGLAPDTAGRLYLASRRHTILRTESLHDRGEVYAGIDQRSGLRDSTRLDSLFDLPAFLAYNQADGRLLVSDQGNHVIRAVLSGREDRVETLAGSGTPGSRDGPALTSSFDQPQGIALDGRGGLWIADSGNHTIRRLELSSGQVRTVAGSAGVAGFRDGTGDEALFATPTGLAVEGEPLLVRLDRERRGLPPPPVRMIVADSGNGVLRRVFEDGIVETLGVTPPRPSGLQVRPRLGFVGIRDAIVDALGNVFFTDGDEVRVLLPNGEVVPAAQRGSFFGAGGLGLGPEGAVVVADDQGVSELVYGAPVIERLDPPALGNRGGLVVVRGSNFSQDILVVAAGRVIREVSIADTREVTIQLPTLPSGITTVSLQNRGGIAQAPLFIRPSSLQEVEVGTITTVAGGTTFIGDGRLATEASLFTPQGLALDADGNLYIADMDHLRIRRVDRLTGLITTVAGTGERSLGREFRGVPAITVPLAPPEKLAVDGEGNLFLSTGTGNVHRVSAGSGLIDTVIRIFGFHELAADRQGGLYLSRFFDHEVLRWDAVTDDLERVAGTGVEGFSGDGGPALDAQLSTPTGMALDSGGNLLIADTGNRRVRRVDARTGTITSATGPLGGGRGVAVDGEGNLYVGDFAGQLIRIDAVTGEERTLGRFPRDYSYLVADAGGRLFVSDAATNEVVEIDTTTGEAVAVAGRGGEPERGDGGPAAAATMVHPMGLDFDSEGNLVIADTDDQRIRYVRASDGVVTTLAGTGRIGHIQPPDGVPALEANLFFPTHAALEDDGTVFFAETSLWMLPPGSDRLRRLLDVVNVQGFTLDRDGNPVFADSNDQVFRYDLASRRLELLAGNGQAGFSGDGGPAPDASLWVPQGLACDGQGNLYIADLFNGRVRRVSAETGFIETVAGGGSRLYTGEPMPATEAMFFGPRDVALDADDNFYVLDGFFIVRVEADTNLVRIVARNAGLDFSGDNGPAVGAGFLADQIEIGPDGNLYLTDGRNQRVRAVRLR